MFVSLSVSLLCHRRASLSPDGNVLLAQALDYETTRQYVCQFYVSDALGTGGPFTYTLNVLDANEAPTFSDTIYYATVAEGSVRGSVNPAYCEGSVRGTVKPVYKQLTENMFIITGVPYYYILN